MSILIREPRAVSALTFAALLVSGCGGGGVPGAPGSPNAGAPAPAAPQVKEALVGADSAALVEHFRDRLAATRPGSGSPSPGGWAFVAPARGATALDATPAPAAGAPTADGGGIRTGASSTLLQEAGVDEEDVVRIDRDRVYALTPRGAGESQRVVVHRASPDGRSLASVGALELDRALAYRGLYADAPRLRLVAVGTDGADGWGVIPMPMPMPATSTSTPTTATGATTTMPIVADASAPVPPSADPRSAIALIDVADPQRPRVATVLGIGGTVTASRLHEGRLWLVVRSSPRLDGFDWSWSPPSARANEAVLESLTADRLLPTWRVDGGPERPLLRDGSCYLQPAAPGGVPSVTTIVSVDLADPLAAPLARCLAAPVDTVYLTPGALYLATQRWPAIWRNGALPPGVSASSGVPLEPVTDLHKFALSPGAITYRGSGSAPGRLSWGEDTARFMLSASGSDLRVLTQRDPEPASVSGPATLTVLRDGGDGALRAIATLPNARRPAPIGKPGERVHGVRFVGQRGYVVTFRRVDPVYVLDLADPTDPKLLGELEVPGFSDRLYPLTDRLLLGVGRDTITWQGDDLQTGVLVSLIDVGDPAQPTERARQVIGRRGSTSAADASPHGAMIRPVDGLIRVALPVTVHEAASDEPPGTPLEARWAGFTRLAAFRWEVDPAAPALREHAPVVAADVAASGVGAWRWRSGDPRFDRAVDLGDTTWLWYDGRFVGTTWR